MKEAAKTALFRKLPSVDELLHAPEFGPMAERDGRTAVADAARAVLDRVRAEIAAGRLDEQGVELAVGGLAAAIERELRSALGFSLRTVINATGVILHTNLGRAPVAPAALDHVREIAATYCNLEFDIERGERGKRDVHVDRLFRRLLGQAEASGGSDGEQPRPHTEVRQTEVSTIVVNNNAAAVLIALNTLAEGGEVIVSRGELVEIGGSFRIPDVMSKSGAVLREVGTTNRTRLADYERAINERTRLLMRVHRSNFQIVGFTEQPSLAELVELGRLHNIPVMEDLGSGALFDLRELGVHGEPGVVESLRAGVDIVTYSGDKLLGGPQAGIISGRREIVAKIRSNPLFRALRVDKLTYAALESTLLAYVKQSYDAVPAVRMMRLTAEEVGQRAKAVIAAVRQQALTFELVEGESVIGGGAAPGATLPTKLIAITSIMSADDLAGRLRAGTPSIIARVEDDRVVLDLRTVFPEQDAAIIRALCAASG